MPVHLTSAVYHKKSTISEYEEVTLTFSPPQENMDVMKNDSQQAEMRGQCPMVRTLVAKLVRWARCVIRRRSNLELPRAGIGDLG